MIAMPICDSIVSAKLLLHSSGASTSSSANAPQTSQRPTFQGWKR